MSDHGEMAKRNLLPKLTSIDELNLMKTVKQMIQQLADLKIQS